MNNKDFDKKIKAHFSTREIKPSAGAWDRLDLNSAGKLTTNNQLWYRVAAVIVLFGLGFSYLYFSENTDEEVVGVDHSSQEGKITPVPLNNTKQILNATVEEKEEEGLVVAVPLQLPTNIDKSAVAPTKQKTTVIPKKTLQNSIGTQPILKSDQVLSAVDKNRIKLQEEDFNVINQLVVEEPSVSEPDIESILHVNITDLVANNEYRVDPQSLLQEVENEIFEEKDKRFREKVLDKLVEGISSVSLALENN